MLAVKVVKSEAEKVRRLLLEKGILAKGFKIFGGRKYVFFPALKRIELRGVECIEKDFVKKKRQLGFRQGLMKVLGEEKTRLAVKAFDLIGEIAVIQVPRELAGERKKIAEALLHCNKRVKTVLEKTGGRKGVFRVQQVEWVAGEKCFLARYKENGCTLEIDLRKAFFSPRLSNERLRVAGLVKNGEMVLVPFAGVGPFAIAIARKSHVRKVIAIELNEDACNLLEENVLLNKIGSKVLVVHGDAKKELRKFVSEADRIVMPLPHSIFKFLPIVFKQAKKNCVAHVYCFSKVGDEENVWEKISAVAERKGRRIEKLFSKKAGEYAAGVNEIVFDLKIT